MKQNSLNINANNPFSPATGGTGNSTLVSHEVVLGEGVNPFNPVSVGPGEILIGTTAGDPVPATLTAGPGIVITQSSGTITIST